MSRRQLEPGSEINGYIADYAHIQSPLLQRTRSDGAVNTWLTLVRSKRRKAHVIGIALIVKPVSNTSDDKGQTIYPERYYVVSNLHILTQSVIQILYPISRNVERSTHCSPLLASVRIDQDHSKILVQLVFLTVLL